MNKFKLVDTTKSKSRLVARLRSAFSKNTYIVLHKCSEGRMTESDIVDLILRKSSDPEKFREYVKSRLKLLLSKISEFDTGYLVIDLDEVTCLKRLVFIITYKLSSGDEIPVSLPKVNERGYTVDVLFTTTTDKVYSDKILLKGSESISPSGDKHFFSNDRRKADEEDYMYNKLVQEILSHFKGKLKDDWSSKIIYLSKRSKFTRSELDELLDIIKSNSDLEVTRLSRITARDDSGVQIVVFDDTIALYDKAATQYTKSYTYLKDNLASIKSELFSAPDEVKKSFNRIVNYFAPVINKGNSE